MTLLLFQPPKRRQPHGIKNNLMQEDFLHHIWKYKLYDFQQITTEQGQEMKIISPGWHNHDAGPDFLNARIEIDGIQWIGNVEIHSSSADWEKHGHHKDPTYDNIILHVVYNFDEKKDIPALKNIPVLSLKNRINNEMFTRYLQFMQSNQWLPCEKLIHNIDRIRFEMWIERLLIEKIETKTELILKRLEQNIFNWEQTFYEFLASNFGFKVNSIGFELLSKSLPIKFINKHKNNLFQIEALLFGQAGMLEQDFNEDYPQKLKNEYFFLKNKYQLKPIEGHIWKYLRMRPNNFPSIRIAQFACLLNQSHSLFSSVIYADAIQSLYNIFQIKPSPYWDNHFQLDKSSSFSSKKLGNQSIDLLIINTVIPFQFLYGKLNDNKELMNKSLQFMDFINGEKNSITQNFNNIGIKSTSAYRSQALIHLKNEYCSKKRCLECAIGSSIIKTEISNK